jgi:signal transduction histidine kinase
MEKINAAHLIIANKQIILQNKKLEKYSEKLTSANKKITVQLKEKLSRESELAIANIQLIFENHEKEKRAQELVIANGKLIYENSEKEKRAEELAIANKKLIFENSEKEKRAEELAVINNKLTKAEILQKDHIIALEEMMFIISHKVRKPVANILGISYLLETCENRSDHEFKKLVQDIIESATCLNTFTQELSTCIHNKRSN